MPSFKSSFLAVLLLTPLVHSSPVIPTALPAHTPWRLRNDPETLLGRRYVVQNHAPSPTSPYSADSADPPPPRSHAQHQTNSSKRSARFAKYLAERAATGERIQTPGGTVVNDYVSNVGSGSSGTKITKAGDTELEDMPSSYRPSNTAVTIVPRPSGTAHAKAADKAKNKSTMTHGKAV